MKLKGLATALSNAESMQDAINDKIDDLDPDDSKYEEKDQFYNDAWMELDAAVEGFKSVIEMKLEDYL